jgi:hypothetical protein
MSRCWLAWGLAGLALEVFALSTRRVPTLSSFVRSHKRPALMAWVVLTVHFFATDKSAARGGFALATHPFDEA